MLRVDGRVVRVVAGDTVPVPGARVVLHQVGQQRQGPFDSLSAGRDGRFVFRFAPDSQAVYVLSARHSGIEYFSDPVPTGNGPARLEVLVSDTGSTVEVQLAARYLLVGAPEAGAGRSVIDVLVLENQSGMTRVAANPGSPTWTMSGLPAAETRIEEGTEFSTDAVRLRGDSLLLFAPISPGRRQLVLSHALPSSADDLKIPMSLGVPEVAILGEEPGLRVEGNGISAEEGGQFEGQAIRRWAGSMAAGSELELSFSGSAAPGPGLLVALVALLALGLTAAALRAMRLRERATARMRDPVPDLLDRLARLDAAHRGREETLGAERWAAYQAERARLKAGLAAALAGRDPQA